MFTGRKRKAEHVLRLLGFCISFLTGEGSHVALRGLGDIQMEMSSKLLDKRTLNSEKDLEVTAYKGKLKPQYRGHCSGDKTA